MTPKHFQLLGVPMEAGAGRRGCSMGPAAYRVAGLKEALEKLGHTVEDLGDLTPDPVPADAAQHPVVRNAPEAAAWTTALHAKAKALAGGDALPIYLGGDHSLALGAVGGHAEAAAATGRPLFVVWFDAHADFNTFETTDSGNIHGMPLAFLCGRPGYAEWIGAPLPATVPPSRVCLFGLRSVDAEERKRVVSEGVITRDMRSIDVNGVTKALQPFLDAVEAMDGVIHVSLDVDFLDPEIAPAVGTTVPGGATYREAHLAMELLHDSGRVAALDLVELNPFLDERGRTARLMVELTASLFGRNIIDRPSRGYGA